jgi:hypothetical protein
LRRYIKGKGTADDKKALSALDASGGFKVDTPGPGYKSKFLSPKRHQVTLTVIGEAGLTIMPLPGWRFRIRTDFLPYIPKKLPCLSCAFKPSFGGSNAVP